MLVSMLSMLEFINVLSPLIMFMFSLKRKDINFNPYPFFTPYCHCSKVDVNCLTIQ